MLREVWVRQLFAVLGWVCFLSLVHWGVILIEPWN